MSTRCDHANRTQMKPRQRRYSVRCVLGLSLSTVVGFTSVLACAAVSNNIDFSSGSEEAEGVPRPLAAARQVNQNQPPDEQRNLAVGRSCPIPPPRSARCQSVSSWSDLLNIISPTTTTATNPDDDIEQIVLCPFSVTKSSSDQPLRLSRPLHLHCQSTTTTAATSSCTISGPRTHLLIARSASGSIISGLTFAGATKSAVRILRGAGSSSTYGGWVRICQCSFESNANALSRKQRRKNKWNVSRGGAIQTSRFTRTVVEGCTFRENTAVLGWDVYHGGSRMEIYDSTFAAGGVGEDGDGDNGGSEGNVGLVHASSSSRLVLADNEFVIDAEGIDEATTKGSSSGGGGGYSAVVVAGTVQGYYKDEYGNTASSSSSAASSEVAESSSASFACPGIYQPATGTCTEFQEFEPATIATSRNTYRHDDTVEVRFTNPRAKVDDWIAVVPSGSIKGGKVSLDAIDWVAGWSESCGKAACISPTTSGAIYFPNLASGRHQVVLLETTVVPLYPVLARSSVFLIKEPPFSPFVPGALSYRDYTTGMRLADGLDIKLLARVGYRIKFDSQFSSRPESSIGFHRTPDGAAVIPREGRDGGWTYMSNSEESDGRGGVFAVQFDRFGNIENYVQRLGRTTRNCAGGVTPWGTWISCEEWSGGQCWQVDPEGRVNPQRTNLVEIAGGNFETVAVDDRKDSDLKFFTSEDHEWGALRRFRPPRNMKVGWDMLHRPGFTLDYLVITGSNTFSWSRSLDEGRRTAHDWFPYSEGVQVVGSSLYLVSKQLKRLLILDLDRMTFTYEQTDSGGVRNGGSFYHDPDQIVSLSGRYVYFTEDGGSTPGVYSRELSTGDYYTIFEADDYNRFDGDETSGIAFSPDGKRLYCCLQRAGIFFQVTRKDGQPFEGTAMSLRFHQMNDGEPRKYYRA